MPKNSNKGKSLEEAWRKIGELELLFSRKTTDDQREAAGASKKASEFRNRTEEARNAAQRYLQEIVTAKTKYQAESKRLETLLETISNLNDKHRKNVSTIEKDVELITTKKSKITSMIDELDAYFENNTDISEQIKKLNDLITTGNEEAVKINQVLKNSTSRKTEIDELYYEILGSEEEDEKTGEATKIEGLRDKLSKAYVGFEERIIALKEELEELKTTSHEDYDGISENWQEKFKALEKEIRTLLPAALTAGLSSAYSQKKKDEEEDMFIFEDNFKKSILGLILVSMIPFAVATTMLLKGDTLQNTVLSLPRILLSILPLYIPVLWLAYSANKKVKLSKRLIEEYTHKEVLSKTYEGLSSQIESISDKEISSELRIKLLYNLLTVSSENPGKLISDYDKSDHPIIDAIDKSSKLSSAVDKLEKIPGFRKVSEIMDKRAKKILDEQTEKVQDALEVIADLDSEDKTGEGKA